MRLTLTDVYLYLICLFPLMTTLTGGGAVNKGMFVLLLTVHGVLFFSRPIKRRTLLALAVLGINYAVMLCSTRFPLENYNLLAYYPFFILYTLFVCDNQRRLIWWFSLNGRFVSGVIAFWCALVALSMLMPGCYQVKEGGKLYFGSFCRDIFRLGPSAVFIQILILMRMLLHGCKGVFFWMAVPMASYLMGSSRTYLVVGFFLLVTGWYLACPSKGVFWGTLLPLSAGMLLLVAVSALGNKIAFTLDEGQYGDFWFRITSSRSYLWQQYLQAWKETPPVHKLLGNHLEFTLQVAQRWAHNDFLELLCSFGILGVAEYCAVMGYLFRSGWTGVRIPGILRLCVFGVWLFNAMFNMHYVYFCAMLGYPFLLFALRAYFE